MKTYDYINRVDKMLPLTVYEGTRSTLSWSLLCITMILCVRRKFFLVTTKPNKPNLAVARILAQHYCYSP